LDGATTKQCCDHPKLSNNRNSPPSEGLGEAGNEDPAFQNLQAPLNLPEGETLEFSTTKRNNDHLKSADHLNSPPSEGLGKVAKENFNPIVLAKDLEKIFTLFPVKVDDGNFLKTIFVYLIKVSEVPKTEWAKALNTIPSDIKENLMTTYTWMKEEGIQEGLQKGRQEGIQEGRQEGIQEGKLESQTEIIMALYDDKIPVQSIARYTKLTEEEVVQILKKQNKIKD
jgi:flagellar biosynthesis/type III secretory pathway protein FliH